MLTRLLDAKLLIENISSCGLNGVFLHNGLEIGWGYAIIFVQAIRKIQDSLDFQIQQVPRAHLREQLPCPRAGSSFEGARQELELI